jgi:hypothetical protein
MSLEKVSGDFSASSASILRLIRMPFLLRAALKLAVGEGSAHRVEAAIDADIPEALKVVLFVAAVCKGIFTSMKDRLALLRASWLSGQSDILWSLLKIFLRRLLDVLPPLTRAI